MNLGDVNVRVIERDSRFTALGIRFWDPVLDAPVRDGLRVILQPGRIRGTPTEGVITPSGAYAFHGIPGLTDYEFGRDEPASPEQVQNYVVHVVDTRGRYVETAFAIELPMADPRALLGQPVSSPAAEFVPGVLLYSGPARRTPAWLGTVRGTLRQLATGEAAAHALVRVTDTDGQRWPAIADAGGQFSTLR